MTTVVLLIGGALLVWLLKSVLAPLMTAEIHGGFDDHLKRRVREAAALLPPALADEQRDEWLEELAALGDRRLRALLFTRGLAQAATAIATVGEEMEAARARDELPKQAHASSDAQLALSEIEPLLVAPTLNLQHHGSASGRAVLLLEDEEVSVENLSPVSVVVRLVDGELGISRSGCPESWESVAGGGEALANASGIRIHRKSRGRRPA